VAEIARAAEKAGLIVDVIHIHPPSDYRKTIRAWRARLADSWTELRRSNPTKYDAAFERVWTFYLASVETTFTEDLMNYRIAQIEVRNVVLH
jgi:cyclopropane fatty-acyl-phospholipid synthase-like methyltransferase